MVPPEVREWTRLIRAALSRGNEASMADRTEQLMKEISSKLDKLHDKWSDETLRGVIHEEQEAFCAQKAELVKSEVLQKVSEQVTAEALVERLERSTLFKRYASLIGVVLAAVLSWLGYTWNLANELDKQFVGLKEVPRELEHIRVQQSAIQTQQTVQASKLDQILARIHEQKKVP